MGALLSGEFDETDGRTIGTSLGFAVFSATAAAGASLRFRASETLRALGLATMVLSACSFLLLVAAIWNDGSDDIWRWFGAAGVAALAGSHASLVSGARRSTDSRAVDLLGSLSIVLAVVDAGIGIVAISGAVDDVDEGFGQLAAALVILLLLATALAPILRRLQPVPPATASQAPPRSMPLPLEVAAVADRIESLTALPGSHAPEIRRECERLRELARTYAGTS